MPASETKISCIEDVSSIEHMHLGDENVLELSKTTNLSDEEKNVFQLKFRFSNAGETGKAQQDSLIRQSCGESKNHIVYNIANNKNPTLDAALCSIPLVYNTFTKQLELQSKILPTKVKSNNLHCVVGNGSCFSMENDLHILQQGDKKDLSKESIKYSSCKSSNINSRFSKLEEKQMVDETLEEVEKDSNIKSDDVDISNVCKNHIQRSPTSTSLQHTDTSSVTSASSIGTDVSFGITESQATVKTSLCCSCDNLSDIQKGAKPKKWGLSNLFLKNLLPWKSKQSVEEQIENSDPTPRSPSAGSSSSRRSDDLIASSTTALILENRPAFLPAKSAAEETKHKQEYEEMVKGARKKEMQDAKFKKKLAHQQQKLEEQLINATKIWTDEILPYWNNVKGNRKTHDLWWKGLPPSIRGRVWKLAIGNDLNITQELYDICTIRSKEKIWVCTDSMCNDHGNDDEIKESAADFIKLDVSRTFPQLGIFQEGGPYHHVLESVLGAYVIYRPDVGYVQGMSFLAAMLLLNMEAFDSFLCFSNLLNRPCQMAFFRIEQTMMTVYYSLYEEYFKENLPNLFALFRKQNLSPDLYLVDWLYTLFSKSLPLDVACRVWDVYLRDGEEFLVRTALGILRLYEDVLLNMDFIHLAQFLTKLPEDIDSERLFHSISSVRMAVNKKPFSQNLEQRLDTLSCN